MAGVTWDEDKKQFVAAAGVDVGFLAATQPSLVDRGIDTEQEIVDWYGREGQAAGAPANRNEQLAREAGYQGNFSGGGTWENSVEPFYDKGLATSGAAAGPAFAYVDGRWTVTGNADPYSYGAAPNSDVWFGAGALEDGYIYNAIGKPKPVITEGGQTVLQGQEIYWDPDVVGGAANAGIMDHRMVSRTALVRGPNSDYTEEERATWQTFNDAPYNNYALVDEFIEGRMLQGDWNDYSATELAALKAGRSFSMGTKQTESEQAQEFIGGHTFNADQFAERVAPMLLLHGDAVNPKTVDPGFFIGGAKSPGLGRASRMPNPSEWWANPGLDEFLKPGGSWFNLAFRDRVNERLGRSSSSVVLPDDVMEYQRLLNPMPGNPNDGAGLLDPLAGRDNPPGGGTSRPRTPRDDVEEQNISPSIFTNSYGGYDDDFLFRAR